jgi:hypothetical protein
MTDLMQFNSSHASERMPSCYPLKPKVSVVQDPQDHIPEASEVSSRSKASCGIYVLFQLSPIPWKS